jgi:hypothetical protein
MKRKGRPTTQLAKLRADKKRAELLANDLRAALHIAGRTMPLDTARQVANYLALRPYGNRVALDYVAFG